MIGFASGWALMNWSEQVVLVTGGTGSFGKKFVELMLRLAGSGNPIRVVEDHVASPTFAPYLAARTADLIERNASGVYHAGGGAPASWFDFAKMIFEVAGVKPQLQPTNEREFRTAARRAFVDARQ